MHVAQNCVPFSIILQFCLFFLFFCHFQMHGLTITKRSPAISVLHVLVESISVHVCTLSSLSSLICSSHQVLGLPTWFSQEHLFSYLFCQNTHNVSLPFNLSLSKSFLISSTFNSPLLILFLILSFLVFLKIPL